MILSETGVSSLLQQGAVPAVDDHFAAEVDSVDEIGWQNLFSHFSDANIYQTWPYGVARSGRARLSHLVVRRGSEVVAIAQARLVLVPMLNFGMAYIFWGPLWRRRDRKIDVEMFRLALRALRTEYVVRRKLVVRIIPNLPDAPNEPFRQILEEEGYVPQPCATRRRTILMDIRPALEELNRGLHQKWRNCLNAARKRNLKIIEGDDDELFEAFERIYDEMKDRKEFVSSTDLKQYRKIQKELPSSEKMRVFLSELEGQTCAGAICSGLGESGIYLFGATSNRGMTTNASYLIQWRVIEWLKAVGCESYDLNGINPVKNEGTYRFKSRLAGRFGRELTLLGQYDFYPNAPTRLFVAVVDLMRTKLTRAGARLFRPSQ